MAKFQVNFVQPSIQRPSLFGIACLVAGTVAAIYAYLSYSDANDEAARWQLRQARLAAPARTIASPTNAAALTTVNAAQTRATQNLNSPWSAWLNTLEAQSDASVAWARLEAQGESRTFRLQGETKSMEDATSFVRRLQQAAWVASAALSEHDSGRVGQDGTAIQFSVDVHWKVTP